MEQDSNARAWRKLGLGRTMKSRDESTMEAWLRAPGNARCIYPDVAKALAECIVRGDFKHYDERQLTALSQQLWSATTMPSSEIKSTLLINDHATS